MPTAPTPITPLPTAPSRADPANFPARADAFMSALPTFGSQLNANASAAFTNASDSVTAATNAAASQTSAAASATAAAASAVTAVNAPGTSGTSTTSLTIGTGSQTFTTQTGKAWVVGQFVTVASTASPTNFMHGQITAYNSGTGSMTVNVLAVGGSGTLASWTIGLVGPNATLTDQNSLQPVALTLPSIRPSLLLDFANSKKLDPRITFTRATSATYYDGVTSAKAEENLLLRSQDFSATWTLANLTAGSAVTAPDGTATGSSFTASAANGTLTQSVTAIAAEYTFSVYLRRVTGTGDIDIQCGGGTWVTQTITSSWARYTVTQTLTAGSRTPGIRIVTSGDQIEVWGAQLEQRSAATVYTPTTTQPITNYVPQLLTAPAGVPRFDHNPTTGESLGLLIEEQRTNNVLHSSAFGSWTPQNVSVSSNVVIAPDGTLTADKIIPNTSSNLHSCSQFTSGSGASTFSVYAKQAEYRYLALQPFLNAGATTWTIFDLQAGTITQTGAGSSPRIEPVGNGWYRCSAGGNQTTFNRVDVGVANAATGSSVFSGDGWSGIYVWGAQGETGAFPTSYIPTTSASVTRTADAAIMTGTNFSSWYNQNESTFYAEWEQRSDVFGAALYVPATNSPSGDANFTVRIGGNNKGSVGSASNTLSANQFVFTQSKNSSVPSRAAVTYKLNDAAFSGNANTVQTDTTCVIPVASYLLIGTAPSAYWLNGTIKKISYYPARLTNAQLQALTA